MFRGRFLFCGPPSAVLAFLAQPAMADCPVPNVLTNGQVADASEVMENFNTVAQCAGAAVTPTGSPQTGAIAVISGPQSVASGNLTGDVTTSDGTATTLSDSGVTAGAYVNPTILVDSKGRITAASNGTGGGGGGSSSPLRYALQTDYAIQANANEQIAGSYTVPFGTLQNGAVIKLRMTGILAATSRQRTTRIKWGGSTLVGYNTTSSSNVSISMEVTLTRRSATSAAGYYRVVYGNSSNAETYAFANSLVFSGTTPNMDQNLTFETTTQVGTGAVANDIIVREFTVEIMNVAP